MRPASVLGVLVALLTPAFGGCLTTITDSEGGPSEPLIDGEPARPGIAPGEPHPETPVEVARGSRAPEAGYATFVIRSESAWHAYWARVQGPCDDADCAGAPPVDFTKHLVVAVVLETKMDACHSARFARAFQDPASNVTTVTIEIAEPDAETACAQVETTPWVAATLTARAGDVRFERATIAVHRDVDTTDPGFRDLAHGATSAVTEPREWLIPDLRTWRVVWSEHAAHQSPTPPLPDVDFSTERVIAVFMGEQTSGGFAVRVTHANATAAAVTVQVRYEGPAPGAATTDALTSPYHFVAVTTRAVRATFEPSYVNFEPTRTVRFTTLDQGGSSAIDERRDVVVTNATAWQALWQEHSANQFPPPDAPSVDFDEHRVLAVFLGLRTSGGYGVNVERIEATTDGWVAHATERAPAEGDGVTLGLTQPFHFVLVPAGDATITVRLQSAATA